jgi:hypothetical protein
MAGELYRIGGPWLKWMVGLMVARVSVLSDELVRFTVAASADGLPVNPTADTVEMAFLTSSANPTEPDWVAGTWDATLTRAYVAQVRSGAALPGPLPLEAGKRYTCWVRITAAASDERVVRCVGVVLVQ